MNDTITRFNYPHTLLKEFDYWVVLLRPKQPTAGCMVLACKEEAESLATVTIQAYHELPVIIQEIEHALMSAFDIERINYLALMMVDKHVHFHVIPRYSTIRTLGTIIFKDVNWPNPPNVLFDHMLSEGEFKLLRRHLLEHWK